MEIKDLRQKSNEELQALIKQWQEDVRRLRFEAASGSLRLVHQMKTTKKNIARAQTLLTQQAK